MGNSAGFTNEQKEWLGRDLDRARVKPRKGRGGKKFDYLPAWDATARANQIFGFDGWSVETLEMREAWAGRRFFGPDKDIEKDAVAFIARVRVTAYAGERVLIREGWGYGDGDGNDLGEAHELAVKEAESDALKRALKSFGNQFGLALYDKDQTHVREGADDEPLTSEPESVASVPEVEAEIIEERSPPSPPRSEERREDPGKQKPKKFAPPKFTGSESKQAVKDAWQKWSRGPSAAVRASASEEEARAMLKANIQALTDMGRDVPKSDPVKWLTGLIETRWPPASEADVIPPPTEQNTEEFDGWLDVVLDAMLACKSDSAAMSVYRANENAYADASRILGMDVPSYLMGKIEHKFSRGVSR